MIDSLRRMGRLSCALMFLLAVGCGSDHASVEASWTVGGLAGASLTLTETVSGRSWTWEGTGSHALDVRSVEFPRIGDGWHFAFELDDGGDDAIECTLLGESGLYESVPEWRIDESGTVRISVQIECGYPLSALVLPDPGLAACLFDAFDPGQKTPEVRELDCSNQGITDLQGIEYLYRLEILDLSHNRIENLDRLGNDGAWYLYRLNVSANELTRLDLSFLREFTFSYIDASDNALTSVGGLEGLHLTELSLHHNLLDAFEVPRTEVPVQDVFVSTETASVHVIDLGHNRLTRVDLSGIGYALLELDVAWNALEELDLTWNDQLERLDAAHNRLSETIDPDPPFSTRALELPYEGVSYVDLSHNDFSEIPRDYLDANARTFIARANAIGNVDFEWARNLIVLNLSDNALASIDPTGAAALTILDLSRNQITAFGRGDGTSSLLELDLSGNPLTTLVVCNWPELWSLRASDTGLGGAELAGCPYLVELELAGTAIDTLDVSSNPELDHIDLRDTPLTCEAATAIAQSLPDATLLLDADICAP